MKIGLQLFGMIHLAQHGLGGELCCEVLKHEWNAFL
jgi:hypothetical protein